MSLSARTDDNTGAIVGEGFVTLSTSAGNALIFSDPASANAYRLNNGGQFASPAEGGFNDENRPSY